MNLKLMSDVKPAVNQIEVSPWFQEAGAVKFNQQQNIQTEAWAPFAEGKHDIFTNETIAKIGKKYGKGNGQVILRWLLQRGIVVIPKSVHKTRMAENKNESQFFDHRDPAAIESIFGQSLKALRK